MRNLNGVHPGFVEQSAGVLHHDMSGPHEAHPRRAPTFHSFQPKGAVGSETVVTGLAKNIVQSNLGDKPMLLNSDDFIGENAFNKALKPELQAEMLAVDI